MGTAAHTQMQQETSNTGGGDTATVPAAPREVRQARVLDPISGKEYYAVYDTARSLIKVEATANSLSDSGFLFLNEASQVTGFTANPASAISEEALVDLIAQLGLTQAAPQEPAPPPTPAPSGQADTSTATDVTPVQLLTELGKLPEATQYTTEIDGVTYLATYFPTEQAVKLVPNRENETSKAEIVVYFNVDGEQVTATQTTVDDAGNIVDDSLANPKVADTALATRVLSDLKGLYDSLAGDATTPAPETPTGQQSTASTQTAGVGPASLEDLFTVLNQAPSAFDIGLGAVAGSDVPAAATYDPATQKVTVNVAPGLASESFSNVVISFASTADGKVNATAEYFLQDGTQVPADGTNMVGPVDPALGQAVLDALSARYSEIKQRQA